MRDADSEILRDDHDSPWKEALSEWFPDFLALLFPEIHADVDWSRGHGFLDTELQQIAPDAETARRYADKLVKVCTLGGVETWVLIHVEVQGEAQRDFAERMYVYHYRLRDRYGVQVVSLAVLTDTASDFRPSFYRDARWGCELSFRFPIVKLLDWQEPDRWQTLESSDNLFALVAMAQIRAKASRDVDERKAWKIRLIRLLYEKGHGRDIILRLFRIIDWMIRLPRDMEREIWKETRKREERKRMVYVTSVERIGIEKGIEQGIKQGEAAMLLRLLERKFGREVAEVHRDRIEQADAETLLTWSERILTSERAEQIFQA